jgi:hypothetical protein
MAPSQAYSLANPVQRTLAWLPGGYLTSPCSDWPKPSEQNGFCREQDKLSRFLTHGRPAPISDGFGQQGVETPRLFSGAVDAEYATAPTQTVPAELYKLR